VKKRDGHRIAIMVLPSAPLLQMRSGRKHSPGDSSTSRPITSEDLLLVSRAIIGTPRRLTRLEEQVADLRSRQDEFDLTPHDMPR